MKIAKKNLENIIKEEISAVLNHILAARVSLGKAQNELYGKPDTDYAIKNIKTVTGMLFVISDMLKGRYNKEKAAKYGMQLPKVPAAVDNRALATSAETEIKETKVHKIIKEELAKLLIENQLIGQLKAALPTVLQNDTAKKIFNVTKKAVQDNKVSVNDLLSVTKGLTHAVKNGEQMANIAVSDPTALQKAGLDIVIGDITQNVADLSAAGRSSEGYSDYLTGGERKPGKYTVCS